jgi:hypothetical protein
MPLVNDGTGVPEDSRGHPELLLTRSDDGRKPAGSLTHIDSREIYVVSIGQVRSPL